MAGDQGQDSRRRHPGLRDTDLDGQTPSVGQRVLERSDAEIAETDDDNRPILLAKVALVAVAGNDDGAHHLVADVFQTLNDVGFTIPAQGCTYWNGPAMGKTDYNDLEVCLLFTFGKRCAVHRVEGQP